MTKAKPYEKHRTMPEVRYADFLRVLTVERFTVWTLPAASTDRVAPQDNPRSEAVLLNALNDANVRGRVHDGKNNNKPGRTR